MLQTYSTSETNPYLANGVFLDSKHPEVIEFTQDIVYHIYDEAEKAVELYYAVRDGFEYNIQDISTEIEDLKASNLIRRGFGHSCEKSNLLAACYRQAGIPARVGFQNLRNSLTSVYLQPILATNIIVFNAYTEVNIADHWVRLYPAFDKKFSEEYKLKLLDFGLSQEKVLENYPSKDRSIEYLYDYGTFKDFPYSLYIEELKKFYPHLFDLEEADENTFLLNVNKFL